VIHANTLLTVYEKKSYLIYVLQLPLDVLTRALP